MGVSNADPCIKKYLSLVRENFESIKEINNGRTNNISLADSLMSGLAIFSLKFPSLLKFEEAKQEDPTLLHNLKTLFKIKNPISDTQVRTRLDVVDPKFIRQSFKSIFAKLQRNNQIKQFQYIGDTYLLANDATGFFSSKTIHCDNCCQRHHKDGSITYYHNMLCGAIVHPDLKEVIPLAPEPILQQDGCTKNDSELNAIIRHLNNFRREHPHLAVTVVEDALYANAPHIKLLKELNMEYIISVKEDNHEYLFDAVKHGNCIEHQITTKDSIIHKFRYINQVPINYKNFDMLVNFIEYWETSKSGNQQYFCWITSHTITNDNVLQLMKGGRARWSIENETFNTLKNLGYHFEKNYGHGNKNLSTIFSMLMMLAFFLDQVQSLCCNIFKAAKKKIKRTSYLWERIRNIFQVFLIDAWEELFNYIINKPVIALPLSNTS